MIGLTSHISGFVNSLVVCIPLFEKKVKKVYSMPVESLFIPCIKCTDSICKVYFLHMSHVFLTYIVLSIWVNVRALFFSKRKRWGEIPRFTGKSPPVRLCYSIRHDVNRVSLLIKSIIKN